MVLAFVISLLVGSAALYVSASMIVDVEDFATAFGTALAGTFAWFVVSFLLGWIPLIGLLVALFAYLTVVNVAYPGGYLEAALIAFVAWAVAILPGIVLWLLGFGGVAGVPFA